MEAINQTFDHAIIATDVGQNQLWATQFLELNEKKLLLTSGDGGIQMNIQEMATAIRVTEEAEIIPALKLARHTEKVPTVIEFIINRETNVWPIVPLGNSLADMLLESEDC